MRRKVIALVDEALQEALLLQLAARSRRGIARDAAVHRLPAERGAARRVRERRRSRRRWWWRRQSGRLRPAAAAAAATPRQTRDERGRPPRFRHSLLLRRRDSARRQLHLLRIPLIDRLLGHSGPSWRERFPRLDERLEPLAGVSRTAASATADEVRQVADKLVRRDEVRSPEVDVLVRCFRDLVHGPDFGIGRAAGHEDEDALPRCIDDSFGPVRRPLGSRTAQGARGRNGGASRGRRPRSADRRIADVRERGLVERALEVFLAGRRTGN